MRAKLRDRVRCRLCGAPVTSEERKQFRQWREASGTLRKKGRPHKPKESQQMTIPNELMIH